jgi:hypothetical protein
LLKLKTGGNNDLLANSFIPVRRLCRLALPTVLILLVLPSVAHAKAELYQPEDFDQVDFYLHTIDVGEMVYDNFGHTALRVHDKVKGTDVMFNWGLFDFGEPLAFSFQFFKGLLKYKLGVYPHRVGLQVYKAEERTVWEDKMNLSREQKVTLWERLRWNARPENVYYNYQYFFDNCSTRPRDYFDEALGGQMSETLKAQSTNLTFRDMVRSHYLSIPFIELSLDILMNARIDRVMTEWEMMFLPATLRKNMLRTTNADGRPVLESRGTVVQFPPPDPSALNGLEYVGLFAIALLGPIAFYAGVRCELRNRLANRLFGAGLVLYGFYFATLSVLMIASWLFSEHLDLHHNANLWLFWPLDYALMLLGFRVLWTGSLALSSRFATFVRGFSVAHLAGYGILFVLRIAGVIEQNVDRILFWGIIYFCLLFLVLIRISNLQLKKGDARVA